MKINDKKELQGKEAGELKKMLKDGHELYLSLKLDLQQNKLKNTRSIYNTRKNIAIIKTILKGKEGEVEKPAVAAEPVKKQEKTEKPEKAVKAVKKEEKK